MTEVTPSIKIWEEAEDDWKFVASGGSGGGGGGGGGGLSLAEADTLFLKADELHAGSGISLSGSATSVTITSTSLSGLPVAYTAPNKTTVALTLRGAVGATPADSDQISVFDGKPGVTGVKTFWLNERGNPRTRAADDNEPAMRIMQATASQAANLLEVNDYTNAVQLVRVGPNGVLIANVGFRLTAGTLGAGRVLTSDASGNGTWQPAPSGGGGLQSRATVAKTSASLAVGASESSTITMAAGYRLYKVTCSAPARVRLYSTTAQRDADASRALGAFPSGNHGLVLEFVSASTLLAMDVTPAIAGHDAKTTPDGAIPITITNLGTSAAAITVTLIWIRTE